ncbi:MAG: hypothetical protein K1X36_02365, partial [Pyrinomonadaceae bacterium]|nr:hypothetical protein [Pyrinomonadaceae bacterium]
MNERADNRILARAAPRHFSGREGELARIVECAYAAKPIGLNLLAKPGAGTTELLRQAFDRLFVERNGVIPVYYAIRGSDTGPREAARRFVHDLLKQTVAFRSGDRSLIDVSPEMHELAQLAAPEDAYWVDRLAEAYYAETDAADDRSYVRMLLSTPLRAAARGARMFLLIDDLHLTSLMPHGSIVLDELRDVFEGSDAAYVFAGARRMMYGRCGVDILRIDDFRGDAAARMVAAIADRYGVAVNDETRDLIAEQLNGSPRSIGRLFASAAERGLSLDSFRAVESLYCDEIFGGRIGRGITAELDAAAPECVRFNLAGLLAQTLAADGGQTKLRSWRRRLGVTGPEFRSAMSHLNAIEYISLRSGRVFAEPDNLPLADHIRGTARLDAGEPRGRVVGEAMAEYVKRAPALMARVYRRNAAFGLRTLLSRFDCQEVPAELIDYNKFESRIKGLAGEDLAAALAASTESIRLPHIVYTAHTSA